MANPAGTSPTPTPMVHLPVRVGGRDRRVRIKLEGVNPSGSVKYRTARALVASLDRRGLLAPGVSLIESTSGNLGVALAAIAVERGLGMVAVVDPNVPVESRTGMAQLGAEVVLVHERDPAGGYLGTRLGAVRARLAEDPHLRWTDQYHDQANPEVHEQETGPELAAQIDRGVQAVFVAVSTGGTMAGIARHFATLEHRPRLVAVDVRGSVAIGGTPSHRHISGIGSGRRSAFLHHDLVRDRAFVAELDAVATCRQLADEAGLVLGASSGAVVAACTRAMLRDPDLVDAVCLSPDFGTAYRSTIYDDDWVRSSLGELPTGGDGVVRFGTLVEGSAHR